MKYLITTVVLFAAFTIWMDTHAMSDCQKNNSFETCFHTLNR